MSEEPSGALTTGSNIAGADTQGVSRQFLRLQAGEATTEDEAAFVRLMEEVAEAERVFHRTTREMLRGSSDEQDDRPAR